MQEENIFTGLLHLDLRLTFRNILTSIFYELPAQGIALQETLIYIVWFRLINLYFTERILPSLEVMLLFLLIRSYLYLLRWDESKYTTFIMGASSLESKMEEKGMAISTDPNSGYFDLIELTAILEKTVEQEVIKKNYALFKSRNRAEKYSSRSSNLKRSY